MVPHPPARPNTCQDINIKIIAKAGENRKITLFELEIIVNSLENNLIASLKGCKTPPQLTLLGPNRI